jgi:Zn-dependent protease with chaperone function
MALTDRIETASLTWMHWLAGALALLSGAVHLVLGIQFWGEANSVLFVLAGLGFFGGILLALVDYRRTLLYLVGVAFVLAQVVAYYFINYLNQPAFSTIEVVDKVAQVVLVVLLVVLYRREA